MISKNVIGIYEGGGGRIAAGGGLFAGGLFAAGLIAGGLFASGLGRISRRPPRQQAHMIHGYHHIRRTWAIHGYHHIRRTYITPTPETTSTHDTWLRRTYITPTPIYMVTIIYAGRISRRPPRQQAHMIHGYHHIRLPPYTPDVYHTYP